MTGPDEIQYRLIFNSSSVLTNTSPCWALSPGPCYALDGPLLWVLLGLSLWALVVSFPLGPPVGTFSWALVPFPWPLVGPVPYWALPGLFLVGLF